MSAAEFVDFAAYAHGVYTPPPALVAIGHEDAFWRTLGGSTVDPWGDGGETMRQRAAASADDGVDQLEAMKANHQARSVG